MKLLIVIEKTGTGFFPHSPDLPGCVATGVTRKQVESSMKKAIEFHLRGMRAERAERDVVAKRLGVCQGSRLMQRSGSMKKRSSVLRRGAVAEPNH